MLKDRYISATDVKNMSVRSSSGSRNSVRSQGSAASWRKNDIKSSGFYPTAMSPAARMGLVDHMNSHYRRIHAVKAVVDTSPPKSYVMRHSPSPSRHPSRPNSRSSSRTDHGQYMQVNREEMLQTTRKINYYLEALQREQQRLLTQVASPNSHFRHQANSSGRTSNASLRSALRSRNRGDLMDKHSDYFTAVEPFTPRVLRTKAKSRIQEYRWYNPPRRKGPMTEDDDSSSYVLDDRDGELERLSDRRSVSDVDEYYEHCLPEQYRDSREKVPKRFATSVHRPKKSSSHESLNSLSSHLSRMEEARTSEHSPAFRVRKCSITSNGHRPTQVQNKTDDEELKYLEFVVDITNDILLRGIYTNKVLKQVFNSHLENKKHELSMEKMQEALKQLKADLGIDDDDAMNSATFGYGTAHSKPREQKRVSKDSEIQITNGHWANKTDTNSRHFLSKVQNTVGTMPLSNHNGHNATSEIVQSDLESVAENSPSLRTDENLKGGRLAQHSGSGTVAIDENSSKNRTYGKVADVHDTSLEVGDLSDYEESCHGKSESGKSKAPSCAGSSESHVQEDNSGDYYQTNVQTVGEKLDSLYIHDHSFAEDLTDASS